jgi:hypothetical protein
LNRRVLDNVFERLSVCRTSYWPFFGSFEAKSLSNSTRNPD